MARDDKNPQRSLLAMFEALEGGAEAPTKGGRQQRGRDFERLIIEMLDREQLAPRSSFRPSGEEIDGSFIFGGRPYLFEAKWRSDKIPASDLYQFKGKVDGKLVGTIGVFLSISGYASDAVDALVAGKALNILLFDRNDFVAALDANIGFQQVLEFKLRAAAETGTPFISIAQYLTIRTPRRSKTVAMSAPQEQVAFVVEGDSDAKMLIALLPLLARNRDYSIEFVVANGRRNIVLLAEEHLARSEGATVVLLFDGEDLPADLVAQIKGLQPPAHGPGIRTIVLKQDLAGALSVHLRARGLDWDAIFKMSAEDREVLFSELLNALQKDELLMSDIQQLSAVLE